MNLNELKTLWKEQGFRPLKKLGQNFIVDNNVRDNIFRKIGIQNDPVIVEIGPGFGVMTFGLAERCRKLIAVEKDRKICSAMESLFAGKNIDLINADILQQDICGLREDNEKLIVYGNIPYYISTPIIERLITQKSCIDSAYLVIQEELADRIVSEPGTKVYGSFSCFVQFNARAEKLLKIKKSAFYPRPRVDSFLIRIKMLDDPSVEVKSPELMFKIIRKAFSQRRKKAVNPLSDGSFAEVDKKEWEAIFSQCGLSVSSRAEMLSLEDYARLADTLGAVDK